MGMKNILPDLRDKLRKLELIEAEAFFNIEQVPTTLTDETFSVTVTDLNPNDLFTDKSDRIFPIALVQVSLMFALGDADRKRYEYAMEKMENVLSMVMNPAYYHSETRNVTFRGTTSKLWDDGGNYIVFDLTFEFEFVLSLYVPPGD